MKKQILILAFFVLAVLAGTNKSFGQVLLPSNVTPVTGTCTSDALHPKAGQSYAYTVASTTGDTPTGYTWWITKNPQFVVPGTGGADQTGKLIVGANQLIATTATGGTTEGTSIDITWSPGILAATQFQGDPTNWATASAANKTPTFVAVMANGNCTNNIQVYEINPKPSFTVDITNINAADQTTTLAYGTASTQCVDVVRGATYSAGKEVTMNYGTNTFYYEVISANFVTSWIPTFTIGATSLNGDQTADISWYTTLANAKAGTSPIEPVVTGQVNGAVITGTVPLTTAETNTTTGVSVYVKVVVHNNKWETLTDQQFALAVDGQDATGQWDLVNSDCSDPLAADRVDTSTQTISARPNINNAIAPAPAPTPDTFINKN